MGFSRESVGEGKKSLLLSGIRLPKKWSLAFGFLFTAFGLIVFPGAAARAATFTVTTTADHDDGICGSDCTLREAINAANNAAGNDTINFAAGVTGAIVITSGLPDLQTNINLQGPGANVLAVSAGGTTAFRIFTITGLTGPVPTVSISGLTISNGIAEYGGGISNNGTLTLTDCILTGNKAFVDGVIFGGGGAIYNGFYNGSSSHPGTLTVTNCTISGNAAANNIGQGEGGGIRNFSGTVTVTRCTLSGNIARVGGAIYNNDQLTLQTSTLSGNTADQGASIYNISNGAGANANVSNCTLVGDILNSGTLTLVSTILQKTQGGPATIVNQGGAVFSQGWNLSSDNGGGFLTGADDQINTDPLARPRGLARQWRPDPNHRADRRQPGARQRQTLFRQRLTSAANRGPFDNPSIPNAPSGDGTDVGAYEADADPIQGALIVNTLADHNDGVCGPTDCTLREAIQRANAQSGANTITFVASLHGTVTLQAALGTLNVTGSTTIIGNGALAGGGRQHPEPCFLFQCRHHQHGIRLHHPKRLGDRRRRFRRVGSGRSHFQSSHADAERLPIE